LLHGPVATGYPALDTWLTTVLLPQQMTGLTSFVHTLLIGSPYRSQAVMPVGESSAIKDVPTSSWHGDLAQSLRGIAQRKREVRRKFLLGAITGVSGIVGLGIIGFVINKRFSSGESTATQSTTHNAGAPTTSGRSTVSSTVIAQVS